MNLEAKINQEYQKLIREHMEENIQGAMDLKANMRHSPMYYKDDYRAKTLQIPKVYSEETICHFEQIVEKTYGIFVKVISEYIQNAQYRVSFPFSKELEELICIPNLYESLLPMARFDIFYHEDTRDFYFCEINTDGTSAMNEDRLLGEFLIDNPAHQEIIRHYHMEQFELFDSWVNTFLQLYDTYEKRTEFPTVAVMDFLDRGTWREFQEFARHFQKAGVNCELCDIREFTYHDGHLYSRRGHRIDAIYRRAVTSDIMKATDEVQPFLQAVRDQAVFLCGSFCTQIIHNKWLFYILHQEQTKKFLTREENAFVEAHIPKTVRFSPEYVSIDEVLEHKERYILKPLDSYASSGVYAGVEYSEAEWKEHVHEVWETDYVCQRYCPQYQTDNIDFGWGDGQWHPYINMAGLYVYNGHFAGVYSRMAEGSGIIASHRNERTVPTFVIKNLS